MEREVQDHQFQRLLQIFPVVRSRNYCEEDRPTLRSLSSGKGKEKVSSEPGTERETSFWSKLKSSVEPKIGKEAAERFCQAFQEAHEDLVFKKVSAESIEKIVKIWENVS